MALAPPSLKGRALRLLSTREHSRLELERKLAEFEEIPGTLAQALDELQAKDFINEQRVLDSVLNRRTAKLGTVRIRQELQHKGLAPEAIQAAVSELQRTELARAQIIWEKKFNAAPTDAKAAAQQMRFLTARGFGAEVIGRVVPRVQPNQADD